MGLESRSLSKGSMTMAGSSSSRKRPYGVLLLLALGTALLSVAVLHKMREIRVLSFLVLDRERDLLALQVLLQTERERNRRTNSRLDDSRDKIMSLTQQRNELHNKLMETETAVADLRRLQKEMEGTLEEKENQIKRMTEQASESAEKDQQVSVLTQLLKQKEAEIERMRLQPSEAQQSKDSKATPGDDAGDSEDEVASHEVSSRNETWVKLETMVEGEGRRDESGSQEKIEASQGSEEPGKQEGEGREIEELQGTESRSGEIAQKEESATQDGDSKELESSQTLLHEEKTGSDSMDSTTIERPKMGHRPRRGRRAKAKSRRRPESEKQGQETANSGTVDADGREELADSAVNEETLKTTTAIPHENEASATMEMTADTKKEDGKTESEYEASKLEVPTEGSVSGGNAHLPETGERAAEEEAVILTDEKPADSARSGDDDDAEESNDHSPEKIQQEEVTSAI